MAKETFWRLGNLPMRAPETFAIYPWQDIPTFNALPSEVANAPTFAAFPPYGGHITGSLNDEPIRTFRLHVQLTACEWVCPKIPERPDTWYVFRVYSVSREVADRKLALPLLATIFLHWIVLLHRLNYGQND